MNFTDYTSFLSTLDSGSRANEGPPPSASWSASSISSTSSGLAIISGSIARPGAGYSSGYWGTEYGADCITAWTVTTSGDLEIEHRGKDFSGSLWDAVSLFYDSAALTLQALITVNGGVTSTLATCAVTISSGMDIGFITYGASICAATFTGGTWTTRFTVVDSTLSNSGALGLWLNGTTPQINNFRAGNIVVGGSTRAGMLTMGVG